MGMENKEDNFMKLYNDAYEFLKKHDIPKSTPFKYDLEKDYYSKGIIRKKDLKDQQYYLGWCRNNPVAMWDEKTQNFWYIKAKFQYNITTPIPHIEDDDFTYDVFIPIKELDKPKKQYIVNDEVIEEHLKRIINKNK